MYKCSECEKEYDIKPDYCDCGNDIFIEITPVQKEEKAIEKKAPKKSFEEQYPGFANFKNSLDPISVLIFCICIILSILSLIFIGRGDNTAEEKKEEIAVIKKINTDIESFWDNSLPKREVSEIIKQEPIQKPVQIIQKTEAPKIITKPKITQTQQTKSKAQTKAQTTKTAQTKPQTQQTIQKKTQQTTQTKPQTQQTTNAKIQTEKIQVSIPANQTTQKQQTNIHTTQQAQKPTNAELQELRNYKNALRNRIFSYIDFTSIVGDGVCVITFTVNDSGKLTNRQFAQKSASTMLNDAVYYAVKQVPTFKQPPSAYKGETLKFTVQFVSGQYEVSLN